MENEPSLGQETPEEHFSETFNIKQGNINYKLYIGAEEDNFLLKITEENIFFEFYEKELNLKDIKIIHNFFSKYSSCNEVFQYIKNQIINNAIQINKITKNTITIKLREKSIDFYLTKKKTQNDLIIMNLCGEIVNLKNNFKNLENNYDKINIVNKNLLHEIENIKLINKELKEENKNMKNDIKKINEYNKKLIEDKKN